MAKRSPTTLHGWMVPDPRITVANIWASESSYTQAGPRPGQAQPQGDTTMSVVASGSQAAGATKRVRVSQGGFPGRDGTAIIIDDNDSDWMGWDPPAALSSFDTVADQTVATLEYLKPSAVALDSGRILVATCTNAGGSTAVNAHRSGTGGDTWAISEIHTEANDGTKEAHPTLVLLPSGRVLCIFLVYDGAGLAQVRVYKTDTDGGAWSLHSRFALKTAIDTSTITVNRMSAAYGNGGIALALSVSNSTSGDEEAWTYASADLGTSFVAVFADQVPLFGSGVDTLYVDVVATQSGAFLWSMTADSGSIQLPAAVRTSTPFESLNNGTAVISAGGDYGIPGTSDIYTAIVLADDGTLYQYASGSPSAAGAPFVCEVSVSFDGGETWDRAGRDLAGSTSARWFTAGNGAAGPWAFSGCWYRGGVHLYSNHIDNHGGATNEDNLEVYRLGGWSNVTMGTVDQFQAYTNSVAWSYVYVPLELPTGTGWTGAGTATSEVVSSGYLDVSVATSGSRTYTRSVTTTVASGIFAEAEMSCTSSGYAELRCNVEDGSEGYIVTIQVNSSEVRVRDGVAASTIGTQLALSSGDRVAVRLHVAAGKVYAAARIQDAGDWTSRKWTTLANGTSLTDSGGTGGADDFNVLFGHSTAIGLACDFEVYRVCYAVEGDFYSAGYSAGFTSPDDLQGRPIGATPVALDDGLYVAATGGFGTYGDTWNIATEYEYPIDNLHVLSEPSPQTVHRTTGTTTPWQVAWQLTGAADGTYETGLWAVYMDGVWFRNVKFQYTDTTSPTAWTDIGSTVDLGTSFAGARSGDAVRPSSSGSVVNGPYIEEGELVGGAVEFSSGEVVRIVRNTAGYLTSGSTVAETRCIIYCDRAQIDDNEDTSGTFVIRHPRVCVILHLPQSGTIYAGIRVIVDPAGTEAAPIEGYYQSGTWALGPVKVFGIPWTDNRRQRWIPNVDIRQDRAGRRRSRKDGPGRIEREVSWTEGVDITTTRGTTTGDDYVVSTSTSGAQPVAMYREAPVVVHGVASSIDGNGMLVVDLPYIPAGTPNVVALTYQRARGALLARIIGEIAYETITGEEEVDEVIRVASVTLEGEV